MTDVDEQVERPRPVWRHLCLSHDPAMIINRTSGGYTDLRAAIDELGILGEHEPCDLMIGGFHPGPNYAAEQLFVVVCPPHPAVMNIGEHQHELGESVQAAWVRLLAAVVPIGTARIMRQGDPLVDAFKGLPACWSPDRARRLRPLLGLPQALAVPRG